MTSKDSDPDAAPARLRLIAISVVWIAFIIMAAIWMGTRAESNLPFSGADETRIPASAPSEEVASVLFVLEGARDVRQNNGAVGSYHVTYALSEKHPAGNAIRRISSQLEVLGWQPLKEDWLNPGVPSSHVRGWTDFIDATRRPTQHVHQWSAQWQDDSGNLVMYFFRYAFPENGPADLDSLSVIASWYPAAGVAAMQAPIEDFKEKNRLRADPF